MKKKWKAVIMILMMVVVNIVSFSVKGYAEETQEPGNQGITVDMTNAFTENNGEYAFIEQKIEDENASMTGLLDEDVEELLNHQGILDEDIEKCSEQELMELEQNVTEDSLVYTGYYAVMDTEELADKPVQQDEMIELTPEQVDRYIAEEYYDIETGLYASLAEELEEMAEKSEDNASQNLVHSVGEFMGLGVQEVCAETIAHGGLDDKIHTSMLRETLVISELKDGKTMHVWFKFEWQEMPKYRAVDSISLSWEGAKYDGCDKQYEPKTTVLHSWYEDYITYNPDRVSMKYGEKQLTKKYDSINLKPESFSIRQDYLCCVIELHADRPYRTNPVTDLEYEYESVAMNFYLKKDSDLKGVKFYPRYIHVKQKAGYDAKNVLGVAASVVDGSVFSAVYTLASGVEVEFKSDYSGPIGARFSHNFK